MAITFSCSTCGAMLQVDDSLAGRVVRCSGCGQATPVDRPQTAFSAAPLAAPVLTSAEELPHLEPVGFPSFRHDKKKVMVLAMLGGLACVLAALAIASLLRRPTLSLADLERFAPDQCHMVMLSHDSEIMASAVWKELDRQVPAMTGKLRNIEESQGKAMQESDVLHMIMMGSVQDWDEGSPMIVWHARKIIDVDQVLKSLKVGERQTETVAGKTCYKYTRNTGAGRNVERLMCRVEPRTLLEGAPAVLRAVLERKTPGKLSPEIKAALQQVDLSRSAVMAMDVQSLSKLGFAGDPDNPATQFLQKVHTLTFQMDMNDRVLLEGALKCEDDKTAEELRALAVAGVTMFKLGLPKETPAIVATVLGKLKFEAKGPLVSGTLELSKEEVVEAARAGEKLLDRLGPFAELPALEPPQRPQRPMRLPPPPGVPQPQPPAANSKLKAPPAPAPVPITPAALEQPRLAIALPGKVGQRCLAGGGRFLVLHFPEQKKLAVFDVSAARIVKEVDKADQRLLLAAGMNQLMVVLPDKSTIERYSVPGLALEKSATYAMKVPAVAAAMGCASNGPLVISGVDYPRLGETMFFDVEAMERIHVDLSPHGIFHTSPDVILRASANGRVFTCKSRSGVQSGRIADDELRIYRGGSVTSVLPSADGRTLFAPGQRFSVDFKPISPRVGGHGAMVWYVPAPHWQSYLSLNEVKVAGKQTLRLDVHETSINKPNRSLGTPADTDGLVDWLRGRPLPFEEHLFLVPRARVLVILPHDRDKLVLLRLP